MFSTLQESSNHKLRNARMSVGSQGFASTVPLTVRVVFIIHTVCLALCLTFAAGDTWAQGQRANKACLHLPEPLDSNCKCSAVTNVPKGEEQGGVKLLCKGLNSTLAFDFEALEDEKSKEGSSGTGNRILGSAKFPLEYKKLLWEQARVIEVKDSEIDTVSVSHFAQFRNLESLSVVRSKVNTFLSKDELHPEALQGSTGSSISSPGQLLRLKTLDLSANELSNLDELSLQQLLHIKELNVSGNLLRQLSSPLFKELKQLEVLDLSSNKLDENLDPKALEHLPKTLKYLDISSECY